MKNVSLLSKDLQVSCLVWISVIRKVQDTQMEEFGPEKQPKWNRCNIVIMCAKIELNAKRDLSWSNIKSSMNTKESSAPGLKKKELCKRTTRPLGSCYHLKAKI